MTSSDRVLDALDDSLNGELVVAGTSISLALNTIQGLAASLRISDSAVRRAVHALRVRGLVRVWVAFDPYSRRRRLYVSGEAA